MCTKGKKVKNEKISIIVPIYKVEQYLSRCVESLLKQTYKNIEIILVDDGSPDQCPKMCDAYAEHDERICVIHKKNGGLSEARNTGLKVANGDYVMYVDSDDYLEADACEHLINAMTTESDFVVGAIREIRGTAIVYRKHTNLSSHTEYAARDFIIKSIENNEWFSHACANLYKKSFLIDNHLFYKVGYYYEDMEMLPRLYLAAKKIIYVDYSFYNYVIREDSIMTSGFTDEKKQMALNIYNTWIKIFSSVDDANLQSYLYGILVKYYLVTARKMKIKGWKIEKLDFAFAWKYALNWQEKIKTVIYNYFPKLYSRLCK